MVNDLALILIVAGIVTLVFKKLKQPLVLGYIVAGFLVSPHMPYIMSVVDGASIHVWADLGVMILLFALGLDFSFKKILKMGLAPVIAALTIVFSMMATGIIVGMQFGWSQMNCIFLGGMLAMSSTTIIYKAFDDLGLRQQKFSGLVMSVLILEDILAIVLMVMLSALAEGSAPEGSQLLYIIFKIVFILSLWIIVGLFLIPTFLRNVRKLNNSETLLIVSLGLCCFMAVVSTKMGFSSAFGAFVMGSILAETIEAERIEKVIDPIKNLFGAIFFVSVGMLVDPMVLVQYIVPIVVITLTIIFGQAIFGTLGYLLSGQDLKFAMRCGFSMAQIGEFAFIIASLGLSLGVISDFVYPVVVAVSVITTFLTPYMIKGAVPAYNYLEKKLPKLWVKRINRIQLGSPSLLHEDNLWRKLIKSMLLNTLVYSMISAALVSLMLSIFLPFVRGLLPHWWANGVCGFITVLMISPFLRAMVVKKNHSDEFKTLWVEHYRNRPPLLFTVIFRVIIAMSFVFYVCNYLSRFSHALMISIAMCVIIIIVLSRALKHSSIRIERIFLQNLRSREIAAQVSGKKKPLFAGRLLDRDLHIGEFVVPSESRWAGKTLRELSLGKRFGISVSSILRGTYLINIPTADDVVFPGDKLRAIGSDEQLALVNATINEDVYIEDIDIESHEMRLHRLILTSSCPFINKTLAESGIREVYNCMLIGLEEGKENLSIVSPDRIFEAGDILWLVGEDKSIKLLEQKNNANE